MTGMLASVMNMEEALHVLKAGVDIIDLKQPSEGALGALAVEDVLDIVQVVQGRCLMSATIGDLPMEPELVFDAVKKMATTRVDYIKMGVFPDGDIAMILSKLAELKPLKLSLIAVLFADAMPHLNSLKALKTAGFKGVMLDTLNKETGRLTEIMPLDAINNFVKQAKQQQLLSGLAGSLKKQDIEPLKRLQPDYLGFRGALCCQQNRVSTLELDAVLAIKKYIVGA
ncbi:MAG: (5-formylfuran-3-yl)methyl phosphate synthase [Methylococcales bacterium]|nr:(5-formylfuran-3-yl)methyl phosphate synthase [Methylococcales bacterium]MCK5926034.1 (5-formylfuran-3-yl)methyl phosphate synthase [Methylococcales bacterium]